MLLTPEQLTVFQKAQAKLQAKYVRARKVWALSIGRDISPHKSNRVF